MHCKTCFTNVLSGRKELEMIDCNVSARFVSPRKAQHIEDVIPDDMIEHIAAELYNGFFEASPFALEEGFSAEFFDLRGSTMLYTRTEVYCGRTITAEDLFCRDRIGELVDEALDNLIKADTEDVEAAADAFHRLNPQIVAGRRSETERKLVGMGLSVLRRHSRRSIYVNDDRAREKVFGLRLVRDADGRIVRAALNGTALDPESAAYLVLPDTHFDCDACKWVLNRLPPLV